MPTANVNGSRASGISVADFMAAGIPVKYPCREGGNTETSHRRTGGDDRSDSGENTAGPRAAEKDG